VFTRLRALARMKGMPRYIATRVPTQVPSLLDIAIGNRNFVQRLDQLKAGG